MLESLLAVEAKNKLAVQFKRDSWGKKMNDKLPDIRRNLDVQIHTAPCRHRKHLRGP